MENTKVAEAPKVKFFEVSEYQGAVKVGECLAEYVDSNSIRVLKVKDINQHKGSPAQLDGCCPWTKTRDGWIAVEFKEQPNPNNTTTLTFGEALEVAKRGYGIYRKEWVGVDLQIGCFIYLSEGSSTGLVLVEPNGHQREYSIWSTALMATDWQVYNKTITHTKDAQK